MPASLKLKVKFLILCFREKRQRSPNFVVTLHGMDKEYEQKYKDQKSVSKCDKFTSGSSSDISDMSGFTSDAEFEEIENRIGFDSGEPGFDSEEERKKLKRLERFRDFDNQGLTEDKKKELRSQRFGNVTDGEDQFETDEEKKQDHIKSEIFLGRDLPRDRNKEMTLSDSFSDKDDIQRKQRHKSKKHGDNEKYHDKGKHRYRDREYYKPPSSRSHDGEKRRRKSRDLEMDFLDSDRRRRERRHRRSRDKYDDRHKERRMSHRKRGYEGDALFVDMRPRDERPDPLELFQKAQRDLERSQTLMIPRNQVLHNLKNMAMSGTHAGSLIDPASGLVQGPTFGPMLPPLVTGLYDAAVPQQLPLQTVLPVQQVPLPLPSAAQSQELGVPSKILPTQTSLQMETTKASSSNPDDKLLNNERKILPPPVQALRIRLGSKSDGKFFY